MAKSQPRITLSVSRDIPFNKLVLSQSNVRRLKAGVAIEELAEDIARRTLLQSLRPAPRRSGVEVDEDDGSVRPLSDRLMTELTAHRTLALREAVANDPDTAFLAMLHALWSP